MWLKGGRGGIPKSRRSFVLNLSHELSEKFVVPQTFYHGIGGVWWLWYVDGGVQTYFSDQPISFSLC